MVVENMTRRAALKSVAGVAGAAVTVSGRTTVQPSAARKATFVLTHPAWHGGWCWKKVTPLLRSSEHEVYSPTLTGLGERFHLAHPMVGLDTHVQDVVNVLEYEDLTGAFKTFTDPVRRRNPAAAKLPRTYIRCRQHPSARFDGHAEMARKTAGWRYRELDAAHEPFVTTPRELTDLLLEAAR